MTFLEFCETKGLHLTTWQLDILKELDVPSRFVTIHKPARKSGATTLFMAYISYLALDEYDIRIVIVQPETSRRIGDLQEIETLISKYTGVPVIDGVATLDNKTTLEIGIWGSYTKDIRYMLVDESALCDINAWLPFKNSVYKMIEYTSFY